MSPLGEYLDAARREKGMTVTDTVREAGLARPTWYSMVTGAFVARSENVTKVARVVGADPDHALRLATGSLQPVDIDQARTDLTVLTDRELAELITLAAHELRRRAEAASALTDTFAD